MGFNTAMMVLNDHLHEIEKDPEFGRKVADAIRYAGRERPGEFHYTSGFNVLPSHHADGMLVVAVGGNTIKKLGMGFQWEDDAILKDVALQRGFRLVKLPTGKPAAA